jgi:hypothetical protein
VALLEELVLGEVSRAGGVGPGIQAVIVVVSVVVVVVVYVFTERMHKYTCIQC